MHLCTHLIEALCQRCTEVHSLTIPPGAGLVGRPYHGPRIDVEELAPTSRRALAIAHPSGIMRALQLVPVIWNRPVHAVGDQGQSTQNISDRDDVDDRPGLWLIEELGSRVCDLPPPVRLPPAARYKTSSEHKHLHKLIFSAHGILF